MGLSVDTFLHHYWLSEKDYVTKEKLYRKVKKEVKKANAQDFLNKLEKDALTYREMNDTASKKWPKSDWSLKGSLDALTIFKVKQQIPIVLALMREYRRQGIKQRELAKALAEIERFHFIFTAVTSQRSSGGISQMYAAAAKTFSAAPTAVEKAAAIAELTNKLRDKTPSYEEFELNFNEIRYTNKVTKQKDLVKYILSKFHAQQAKNIVANYDLMTIEHILSQSEAGQAGVDEGDIGRIGNLMLVPAALNNEQLGNKTFVQKKRILQDNQVQMDDTLKQATVWTGGEIDKRTRQIAAALYGPIQIGKKK